VLALVSEIERQLGRAEGIATHGVQPLLRKQNRVRTIRGSVAIEGNTLSEQQITAILSGRRVIGSRREIL
jgi:Fic family protein